MSSEQRGSQLARSKWRCGVTGAMLLGLPLSLLGLATTLGRRGPNSAPGLCDTAGCRTAALALNVSLSRTVQPCDDFSRFVCEGWRHLDRTSSRVQLIMNYAWTAYSVPHRAQTAVDKVVALYQSCVASLSPGGGDLSTLRSFLGHLGLGPGNVAPGTTLRAMLQLSIRHSVNILLDVGVNGTTLSVSPVNPPTGGATGQATDAAYVQRISELVLLDDPQTVVHDVLALQNELNLEPPLPSKLPDTLPLVTLGQETGTLDDWLSQLPSMGPRTSVTIQGLPMVRRYAMFLRKHRGDATLRRYVAWHTARILGSLTQYDLFRTTLESALGKVEPTPGLIKATCLAHAANLMPLAYNVFVVRHFATRRSRRNLEAIAESLRGSAAVALRISRWMSDRPKSMATLKLKKLVWVLPRRRSEAQINRVYARLQDLGVTDFLQAYLMVTKHNGRTVLQDANQAAVDVVYSPHRNAVVVSAGMLNTPFFEDTLPAAFNCAGLGQRMALELLHAIDEHGRWYDERGRNRDWWDVATSEAFQHHLQCSGGQALLESSALHLAFQAFHNMHQNVLLKGLQNFTPDQMFFISSCLKWCGHENSPCNAAVQNLQEFSLAFKCKPDDAMNPPTRCALLL